MRRYSLTTAENGCKWTSIRPDQDTFDFDRCDAVAAFAESNDLAFRGHNLCWGAHNPSWLDDGGFNASALESLLEDHISTVIKHYGAAASWGWDVVNEAIADSTKGDVVFKSNVCVRRRLTIVRFSLPWPRRDARPTQVVRRAAGLRRQGLHGGGRRSRRAARGSAQAVVVLQ